MCSSRDVSRSSRKNDVQSSQLHSNGKTMNRKHQQFIIGGILWVLLIWTWTYIYYYHPGLGTSWVKQLSPSTKISSIKLGAKGEVIAETTDGKFFEYTDNYSQTWTEVNEPSGRPAIGGYCSPGNPMYIVVPPPGQVKYRVKETCAIFETGVHLELVLLENNEIWSWEHDVYAYTHVLNALCLGTIGSIGIPFVVIGLVRILRKTKQTNNEVVSIWRTNAVYSTTAYRGYE